MRDVLALHLELRDGNELVARYTNTGDVPLALTFWWNRTLRVVDAQGAVMTPVEGPVLPCGANEDWHVLAPGASVERTEAMACTQPAGRTEKIGWSYDHLPAGRYHVTLVYEAPPVHGFTQSEAHANAFTGRVESNAVTMDLTPRAKKRGLLAKLFG